MRFVTQSGLETAVFKSVSLLTFFVLTLPSPGRVEEEINKNSPHLTPNDKCTEQYMKKAGWALWPTITKKRKD